MLFIFYFCKKIDENMTDVIINRNKKTVLIASKNLNRIYEWIDDNVNELRKHYIIKIKCDKSGHGEIILPSDITNMITIGNKN